MSRRGLLALLAAAAIAACGSGPPGPVAVDLGRDACGHCRMTIVSTATAAQIVAPGEEPVLFDDLGCLRDFSAAAPPAAEARVFVADHLTGDWVDARQATFTRTSVDTPMGSGLLAHADAATRDRDPATANGSPVAARALLP